VQLIAKVLDDKLKPIKEDIKLIKQQIQDLEKGELSSLRADLVQSFNLVVSKGYRTINDTQSWLSMYESYKGLGGNSFIDRLKGDFESLPTEMEYLNNKQQ
jgi:hypothetical protein